MNFSDYDFFGKGYDDYFSWGDYIVWEGHIFELHNELIEKINYARNVNHFNIFKNKYFCLWLINIKKLNKRLDLDGDFSRRKDANDWGCGLNVYNDYLNKMDDFHGLHWYYRPDTHTKRKSLEREAATIGLYDFKLYKNKKILFRAIKDKYLDYFKHIYDTHKIKNCVDIAFALDIDFYYHILSDIVEKELRNKFNSFGEIISGGVLLQMQSAIGPSAQ